MEVYFGGPAQNIGLVACAEKLYYPLKKNNISLKMSEGVYLKPNNPVNKLKLKHLSSMKNTSQTDFYSRVLIKDHFSLFLVKP